MGEPQILQNPLSVRGFRVVRGITCGIWFKAKLHCEFGVGDLALD